MFQTQQGRRTACTERRLWEIHDRMLSTTAGTVTDFRAAQKRMSIAHGEGKNVSIGGHVYQPADDTSKEELASGSRTIEDLSRRLIEQARDCADAYVTDYEGVKRLLDTHEGRRRTARRAEQEERRAKAAEQRRQLKGANIFIQRPQRPWHATNSPGGSIDFAGSIPSLPPIGHVPWTAAAQRDDERDTPLGAFKEALASNLRRVSELFHKWEVHLDEHIDLQELRDAVGVLNLARSPAWDEDCVRKFYAQLDGDNSGYIEFSGLHDQLKRYQPPDLGTLKRGPLRRGSSLISLQPPVAKLPPMGPARPEIAVTNLESLLVANQSRVIERFRRWDFSAHSAISATELRRALSALCIHADAKTTEKLFKLLLDVKGAGSITLDELSQILVKRVASKGSLVGIGAGTGTWHGAQQALFVAGHASVAGHYPLAYRWPTVGPAFGTHARSSRLVVAKCPTRRRRLVHLLLLPTQPRVSCFRFRRRRQAAGAQHDAQRGAPCRGSQPAWGDGALSVRAALVASLARGWPRGSAARAGSKLWRAPGAPGGHSR